MPRIIRVVIGASLAFLVVACAAGSERTCSAEARSAVDAFVGAMNTGDAAAAEAVFAEVGFNWFSEAPHRVDPAARQRDTLANYLADRVAVGARYQLTSFDFNGETGGLGNFGLVLINESQERVDGKGAIDCDSAQIVAMSLGQPH